MGCGEGSGVGVNHRFHFNKDLGRFIFRPNLENFCMKECPTWKVLAIEVDTLTNSVSKNQNLRAPGGALAVGSIYRQWTDSEEMELTQLCDQMTTITEEYGRVVIMGDFNLDVARVGDPSYYRRRLLGLLMGCLELNELILANLQDLSPTYHSHGTFDDGCGATSRRTSILDHIYFRGLHAPSFNVLPTAMTDHRPVVARFCLEQRGGLRYICRRDFKSISVPAISMAINVEALSRVFMMEDVEEIHTTIVNEVVKALDLVAPLQQVQVKDRRAPLYLTLETRRAIHERDRAASRSHVEYRQLRNRAARLVRRDRLASNIEHLQERGLDPKSIWDLANAVSGRTTRCSLPAELQEEGSDNSSSNSSSRCIRGDTELADCVNRFYIDKIDKIRAGIDMGRADVVDDTHLRRRQQQQQHWQRFEFRAPTEIWA